MASPTHCGSYSISVPLSPQSASAALPTSHTVLVAESRRSQVPAASAWLSSPGSRPSASGSSTTPCPGILFRALFGGCFDNASITYARCTQLHCRLLHDTNHAHRRPPRLARVLHARRPCADAQGRSRRGRKDRG